MDHSYYFRRRSSITDGRATSFGAGTLCFVQPQRPLVAVALWLPYILEVSTLPSALQMRGNALLNALERSERGMVEGDSGFACWQWRHNAGKRKQR
jgi:hypothetical protein